MKKINFKILKEMDGKAFFKVEIPKSINIKEIGVMLSLSTDTITIEHSLSVIDKEKEEAEIKSSLARSEPAFILDNFIYLCLDTILLRLTNPLATELESIVKNKTESVIDFFSNLKISFKYYEKSKISHMGWAYKIVEEDKYILDRFFLPVSIIFKEARSSLDRIKFNEFLRHQLISWLKNYSDMLSRIMTDDNTKLLEAENLPKHSPLAGKGTSFDFFIEDIKIPDSITTKYVLVLEDGGEYGGPSSNHISSVALLAINNDKSFAKILELSADGYRIETCLFTILSMYHYLFLEDLTFTIEAAQRTAKSKGNYRIQDDDIKFKIEL